MRCSIGLAICLACGLAAEASAQVIQLPSFSTFSVNTTVVVPDSGPSPVARNRRSISATHTLGGLPPQRAVTSNLQAAGVGVVAQIHDPQPADEALLREAQARHAGTMPGRLVRKAPLASAPTGAALASVAELRKQRGLQAAAGEREAANLLTKARQAQAAGKSSVAAIYYRSAVKAASGKLKQQIETEQESLEAGDRRR